MVKRPNGLAFSPDEKKLYVIESQPGARAIYAFDVATATKLAGGKKLIVCAKEETPDGFRVDVDGNLWCGWGMGTAELDGVRIFNPQGQPIGHIGLPERAANVCFGGPKRNRLFMAAMPFDLRALREHAGREGRMMADALPGILAIFNNAAPGREAEFEEWFQHEHLAERIAVPGFLLGRRYEAVSGQPRYFNFYLTQSADVLKSAAYLERLDHPTPMTQKIMSENFQGHDPHGLPPHVPARHDARLGGGRGAIMERADQNALKTTAESLRRTRRWPARKSGRRWTPARISGVRGGAAARRRPQDRGVSLCRDAADGGC